MKKRLKSLAISVALAAGVAALGALTEGLTALLGGPDVPDSFRLLVPIGIVVADQIRQELERYRSERQGG